MSILYCSIPHFAAALVRRDDPDLQGCPLVLIGPGRRVFGVSAEAAACGVAVGLTARAAEIHCPEAHLMDADIAHCRQEFETLLQLLEHTIPKVEPHGWGSAYVDLFDLTRVRTSAVDLCQQVGRAVRRELGEALQPALGWDSSKFTAQAAARRARPGHLLAVAAVKERVFLEPLPVTLLPLAEDALRRLCFLGLRTLGQYAALPSAAVWQQFGRAGKLAHRYARGEDNRPVVPRWQAPRLTAECEFEAPMNDKNRLMAALRHLVSPLVAELQGDLQACGRVRLTAGFKDGDAQERARTFLFPVAEKGRIIRALGQLLDGMCWQAGPSTGCILGPWSSGTVPCTCRPGQVPYPSSWGRRTQGGPALVLPSSCPARTGSDQDRVRCPSPGSFGPRTKGTEDRVEGLRTGAASLAVALEQIQDAIVEQLSFFPVQDEREQKLRAVQRYLAMRFGANRLRQAVLAQPGAPLPEWRVDWLS
jgi:nucleotidyltransferase/DNA polymerase involved in DNA repair